MMYKVLYTLTLVSTMTLGAFAQSNKPQAAKNPNLEAKRLQKQTQATTKSAPQVVNPMGMAKKYEEVAIRKWKKEHPEVLFFSQDEYNKLDAAKKAEVGNNVITYGQEIMWADIQKFESEKKQK